MVLKRNLALFALTVLFSHGASVVIGQQTKLETSQVDIILLIDCSRSTKTTDPESLRVRAARFLLAYLDTALTVKGATYRVGVANFSDTVGKTIALGQWPGKVVWDSLRAHFFHYTDFTLPLEFALKELHDKNNIDAGNRRAAILFTDD